MYGLAPVVEAVDIVLQFHRLTYCLWIIRPIFKEGRHLIHQILVGQLLYKCDNKNEGGGGGIHEVFRASQKMDGTPASRNGFYHLTWHRCVVVLLNVGVYSSSVRNYLFKHALSEWIVFCSFSTIPIETSVYCAVEKAKRKAGKRICMQSCAVCSSTSQTNPCGTPSTVSRVLIQDAKSV